MRGPIDYIVVSFEGLDFKGEALDALHEASENGTIKVLDIALVARDEEGNTTAIELADVENDLVKAIAESNGSGQGVITDEDIEEISELLEDNTAAGLLIIEQLWAIPLKKALIDAKGTLVAEGRIHPDAQEEIDSK